MKANVFLLLFILAIGFLVGSPSFAHAKAKLQSPSWSKSKQILKQVNISYMTAGSSGNGSSLNQAIFTNSKLNDSLRYSYELQQDQFEARKNQGLVNAYGLEQYSHQMKAFAQSSLSSVSRAHLSSSLRKVRKISENLVREIREPVGFAVFMLSVYSGEALRFKLASGLDAEARTQVKAKAASLLVKLSNLGISSAVAFEGNNVGQKVNAIVSKQITDQISASVQSQDKGTLSLNYGLSF